MLRVVVGGIFPGRIYICGRYYLLFLQRVSLQWFKTLEQPDLRLWLQPEAPLSEYFACAQYTDCIS